MCVLLVCYVYIVVLCFFFKQKTAYEMRISDWSSDVCSSDLSTNRRRLAARRVRPSGAVVPPRARAKGTASTAMAMAAIGVAVAPRPASGRTDARGGHRRHPRLARAEGIPAAIHEPSLARRPDPGDVHRRGVEVHDGSRSEEHTSELESLMRIS